VIHKFEKNTGMEMNKYIYIIMLLLINTSVFPNDSRVVLGSSVEIINNENTNIAMLEKLNASVELEMASDKQKEDEAKETDDPENTVEKQPDRSSILTLMKTNLFIRYLIFIVLHITIAITTIICVFKVKKIRKKRNNADAE
jgi:2-methylaconitate cis-trans-isomerase PrpF